MCSAAVQPSKPRFKVPDHLRHPLLPVAKRVFWWGDPSEWLGDTIRFVAQVMTFGDWEDTVLVSKLLGEEVFQQVIADPPPGVFDAKSWNFWHLRYGKEIPPLPVRKL